MPINGVKWRFLGLNEKRCKRTYYIYIYRKSTYYKKVFLTTENLRGFAPKPPAGTPSLHPDLCSPQRAGGTAERRCRPL